MLGHYFQCKLSPIPNNGETLLNSWSIDFVICEMSFIGNLNFGVDFKAVF